MEKIIAAFDGLNMSESTIQYAVYIAKRTNAQIIGVFLREFTQLGYAVYATLEEHGSGKNIFDEINRTDQLSLDKSAELFKTICEENQVSYKIHKDKGNTLEELIHESIFADLLIIDAWETFSYIENDLPAWFVKNILHDAQCPVLVVPKKFRPIKKVVFLYDGSPSSVHAIKMFRYTMREMKNMKMELICFSDDSQKIHFPDNKLIKEWMNNHFPQADFTLEKGKDYDIPALLSNNDTNSLIVAGSYHRSRLSMWVHKSLADLLIRDAAVPIFISHT